MSAEEPRCPGCGRPVSECRADDVDELLTGKHPKSHGDATVAMDADDPRWNNCAECGERFAEDETPVPSRSISGGPLVHEECA